MPIKMTEEERGNWARHFDNLTWQTTSILVAALIALIGFMHTKYSFKLCMVGLYCCLLPLYFAASFRNLFDTVTKGSDSINEIILAEKRFPQWWLYHLVCLVIGSIFVGMLLENSPQYKLYIFSSVAIVITLSVSLLILSSRAPEG